ncbi:DNA mismatch repair protein MutS [Candidatus Sumerlaeota bacterium]|nr:DNA mismatch repair protein MutS [Candidatus Sumerlaeota bacterium]
MNDSPSSKNSVSSSKGGAARLTPMVRQYNAVKGRYPQYIIMFRMGDFYEMFNEDAETASRILGIALTKRPVGESGSMPLAGVPYHALEAYLAKFIRAGKKVAICDQIEDPKLAKGIVKREVVRIVTPGTILETDILDAKAHNFLVAACEIEKRWGLAVTDLSIGAFEIAEFTGEDGARQILSEIGRLQPAEVLAPDSLRRRDRDWLDPGIQTTATWLPDTDFDPRSARRLLLDQFQVQSLEGYGAEQMPAAVGAAGALVQYLRDTQMSALGHINHLQVYSPSDSLVLDFTTQRSLELVQSIHGGGRAGTLLEAMDHTITAMGGRLLREWILKPLKQVEPIRARLDAVEELYANASMRAELGDRLRGVYDLERIISRIGLRAAGPRDLASLRQSLSQVEPLSEALGAASSPLLVESREELDPHPALLGLLQRGLAENPPYLLRDGGVIREGFNAELDEVRSLARDTSEWMEAMRREEIERTGIPTLKIGYNKVFGFYIEISKAHADKAPPDYVRKQTLVNAERFITEDLKKKEEIILHAQERIAEIEARLFEEIRAQAASYTRSIQRLAACIARIDCLLGLAALAIAGNYVKPSVDEGDRIEIRAGRHPVVEAVQGDQPFVPNDVCVSNSENQILIITGPNMAGKSTFIRQVALIALMAHAGSFVPAAEARIGLVDRIFTRVGAMDYLVRGQSTFLVEMSETANILNNATDRSLVILDEIGRGTSTYDGLSIAWAVVEHLHSTEGRRPKTLFATHYHELTDLEERLDRVANYNVAVLEEGGEIAFLYRIVRGGTDHSYGIYAGKVAGLPRAVIDRAQTILHQLEFGHAPQTRGGPVADRRVGVSSEDGMVQLSLFDGITHPVVERLRALDVESITPVQALQILSELAEKSRG